MSTVPGVARPSVRRTRLVATIGPASVGLVDQLVDSGLDVARINLSHGSSAEHMLAAQAVRAAASASGRTVGILVDLPGPKLRLGELGADAHELQQGALLSLTGPDVAADAASLPLADAAVPPRLLVGDRVLLADGAAELRVVSTEGLAASAEVVRAGFVRSRQGVSVPAGRMVAAALSAVDEASIPHLIELRPDFVGQSFVRSAADVKALRARIPDDVAIVAKIETQPAVDSIRAILEVADAIMVARGDLGVELPFEQVPMLQKELVKEALAAGRPSIVATQLLESMIEAPRPTRAEASDVANAVLDGADAVMLSAETAVGRWPVEALRAAAGICEAADRFEQPVRPPGMTAAFEHHLDARALAQSAVTLSDVDADVVGLACYTRSGWTARLLSTLRPRVPVLAFTPSAAGARALSLHRGVYAVDLEVADDDPAAIGAAVDAALTAAADAWAPTPDDALVLVQTSRDGGRNSMEVLRPQP